MAYKISAATSDSIRYDGASIDVTFTRTSPTTGNITWTVPTKSAVYDGALIVINSEPLNVSNYPTDGQKYVGSLVYNTPINMLGTAVIVSAAYGNKTLNTLDISGLDPDDVYYVACHLVTNVRQYYTVGSHSYADSDRDATEHGDFESAAEPPVSPSVGDAYYNTTTHVLSFWDGTIWSPITQTIPSGRGLPQTGAVGSFFYDLATKQVYTWNSVVWTVVNTANVGIRSIEKVGIGTDGSYDSRRRLTNIVKHQLGYPTVCVELQDAHFDIAIDNAIAEVRRRVDNAYERGFVKLTIIGGQSVYWLNNPAIGTDRVVSVIKVNRMSRFGTTTDPVAAQMISNQIFMPGGGMDLLTTHMVAQMGEHMSMLSAGEVQFIFNEVSRELNIHRRLPNDEVLLLEVSLERTEQSLINDRWLNQWIQGWAISECHEMLGMIRTKFGTLSGAGGGISLNGDTLLARADADKVELLRQISDNEVGNTADSGWGGFLIG